jgi:peptide/nickel transport system ATP-binding protein
MVFQNGAANLNPVHRIVDQVAEPLIQHGRADRRKAGLLAADALRRMGMGEELHGRYPHQLSGGQAQRVLLTMAMILDPSVVILDEPTSALDALNKAQVAEVISEARAEGKALLLITHDLEFARHHADTAAVLYLGQVMEILPAGELLAGPRHPYTLALGRSFPTMTRDKELGGIRGDAFYRMVHQHGRKGCTGTVTSRSPSQATGTVTPRPRDACSRTGAPRWSRPAAGTMCPWNGSGITGSAACVTASPTCWRWRG